MGRYKFHLGSDFSLLRISAIVLILISFSCKQERTKTKPEDYFTDGQKAALLKQIVVRTVKKPEGLADPEQNEAYYAEQTKLYKWHFAHRKDGGVYYFVSRPAPSLYGKRSGLGGFFQSPDNLTITGFKEIFHTFKMKPGQLLEKGTILFEKMVNREDLSSYYPDHQKEKGEWIEFPDQLNYYDSTSQVWKMN